MKSTKRTEWLKRPVILRFIHICFFSVSLKIPNNLIFMFLSPFLLLVTLNKTGFGLCVVCACAHQPNKNNAKIILKLCWHLISFFMKQANLSVANWNQFPSFFGKNLECFFFLFFFQKKNYQMNEWSSDDFKRQHGSGDR